MNPGQVADAEGCSTHGEAVCSREVWRLVSGRCRGDPRGDAGCVLLIEAPSIEPAERERLEEAYLALDLLNLQKQQFTSMSMPKERYEVRGSGRARYPCLPHVSVAPSLPAICSPWFALLEPRPHWLRNRRAALVHETARRAIDVDALSTVGERRSVVLIFCMVQGLEEALSQGEAGLPKVQMCLAAVIGRIHERGGLLCQFILDDKGMVCIWTFGLPNNSFEDNGHRGLHSCLSVASALADQGLATQIGISSRQAPLSAGWLELPIGASTR